MSLPKNIPTEYLGMSSLNSFAQHNSSSRAVMYNSHFSQKLVVEGADEKRIQTGVEREFSKHTFSVQMPEDGKIIKIIDRYPRGIGRDSMEFNPETIVIYEKEETKEIDYFSIPYYCSNHQFFGFKYRHNPTVDSLRPGAYIPKGSVFADSPGVGENGAYNFGVNMNVAFMSVPSISEDGIMISSDVLEKFKFRIYETRIVEFGSNAFPLNLFGNKDYYKPFKDIGEYIEDNGLLMMTRSYDDDLAPVDTSIFDTMEPDFLFDKGVYVRGGRGKIVDIKVIGNNSKIKQLPEQITEHVGKYQRALLKFHQEIIATEEKIRYERKKKFGTTGLNLSPKFHRLIVESLAITNYNSAKSKQSLNLLYRENPIDEYRIEFVVEYEMIPGIGYKMTDMGAG